MAIIKCPECGRQISDKAPLCPSCGVEIAGKITKCPYCGEVYFKSEIVCPHCHKPTVYNNEEDKKEATEKKIIDEKSSINTPAVNVGNKTNVTPPTPSTPPKPVVSASLGSDKRSLQSADKTVITNSTTHPATPPTTKAVPAQEQEPVKKNSKAIIIISCIIAAIVLGVCYYVYNNAQSNKEEEEYEFAMQSNDPTVLKTYLDNFKDAPQEHIDSINAHLLRLTQVDDDWTNTLVSGSKAALMNYIKTHPDSPHMAEALAKIDSIDWEQCTRTNTIEAYQMYLDNHEDGNHYDEAILALKKLQATQISASDRQAISSLFHTFFISINSKDEDGLTSTVSDLINFLGKSNATKSDIVAFMHKLYKPDVKSIIWSLGNNYNIQKKVLDDETAEYTVSFMASEKVDKLDDTSSTSEFKINAKVYANGKISDMSMTKLVDQ